MALAGIPLPGAGIPMLSGMRGREFYHLVGSQADPPSTLVFARVWFISNVSLNKPFGRKLKA